MQSEEPHPLLLAPIEIKMLVEGLGLRRLKRKGLIEKIPQAHRYRLTSLGRRVAVLFTKAYGRVLAPGLSALDLQLPVDLIERSELSRSWRCFDQALDVYIQQQMLAA